MRQAGRCLDLSAKFNLQLKSNAKSKRASDQAGSREGNAQNWKIPPKKQ